MPGAHDEKLVQGQKTEREPRREPYRVFISSTYLDNVERRVLVTEAVELAEMLPVGMERFTASARPTVDECVREAARCDIYVGIIAHRYGWIPDGHKVSITELEYDAAKGTGRACYVFLLSDEILVDPNKDFDVGADRWQKQACLEAFRAKCSRDQRPARFTETRLQAKVLQALTRWRREREPSAEPHSPDERDVSAADLEDLERYKRNTESDHNSLALAGFVTRVRVKLDVEELYVPLSAMVDLRGIGDAEFADASDAEHRLAARCREIALVNAFVVAEQRKQRGLVILGDPGSGKTTHLRRLVLYCLRNGAQELGLAEDLVPVFLPLRELGGARSLQELMEQQLDREQRGLGADFGKRLLQRGRLLLLLDGLDEVADPQERAVVAQWIEQTVRDRPDCVVVVTCRFAGYGGAARLGVEFLELHLRPMMRDQSEAFIRNWYRLVETGLAPDQKLGQQHGQQKAEALIARLREPDSRSTHLVTMTRNPLLLANMCLVHRDLGQLPSGRARLYSECIDVLVEHWRHWKSLLFDLTAQAGRRALQPVALWMHSQAGRVRASADMLAPVLEPALAAIQYRGGAREFLRTVRDASGLLTGWSQDQYGFMHLGFQEYLAASELRRLILEGDAAALQTLADGYGQSWWQEVILVLIALGDPSAFVPLMREVVQRQAFAEESALLDLIFEDAAEVSALPFVELLQEAPGEDRELWSRQQMAMQVLDRHFASALDALVDTLLHHPSAELRDWATRRWDAARLQTAPAGTIATSGISTVVSSIVTSNGAVQLVLIPGGTFIMGSPESEEGRYRDEGPTHEVAISSFYLGRYPVTNEEYGRFLKANPDAREPQYWAERRFNQARQPVTGVSWQEAERFAHWVGCRLPTEAEWEYACRAGTTQSLYGQLDEIAWYAGNSGNQPHPVGMKQPNLWGLHDMLGNVLEWGADRAGPYEAKPETDPSGLQDGAERVVRGGSWYSVARHVRAAYRSRRAPDSRIGILGFRLAQGQSPAGSSPAEPARQVSAQAPEPPEPSARKSQRRAKS